ncbi:MAG TPA: ABC transporter ATP-binding protein [Candidatus Latescibacteria bacterium]|nr:ABC transporter ATP-binding protein [Candidatus Latescibacterota bacterium]
MAEPIVELEDITFAYPSTGRVLDGLNFKLYLGDRIGISGPNGSGKTTLFHIIMGLLRPESGTVRIFGRTRKKEEDFREVRERIGLLMQDPDDQLFCPTVEEDIAFGPLNLGKPRDEVRRIVQDVIELLGLEGKERRFSYALSYGEKRLVSLATVLAMQPEVLLLDEPTAGLDEETYRKIVNFLNSRDGLTYCVVSHDLSLLEEVTDKVYRIMNGKLMC